MPATRSSARLASKSSENLAAEGVSSSPPSSSAAANNNNDNKRKATDSSPASAAKSASKKSKKAAGTTPKKQKTIDETMELEKEEGDEEMKDEMKDETGETGETKKEEKSGEEVKEDEKEGEAPTIAEKQEDGVVDPAKDEAGEEAAATGESTGAEADVSAEEQSKDDTIPAKEEDQKTEEPTTATTEGQSNDSKTEIQPESSETKDTAAADTTSNPIQEDKARGEAIPSTILEKGIIYFFTRASVAASSDTPSALTDIARSYLVLRPLPPSTSLGSGPLPSTSTCRLLALPKKVLPKSGRDRFMAFVEQANVSIESLKTDFMAGSDYSTKTTGVRHAPPVTPVGEGVYALTSTGTGRTTSHLAYMLTLPEELGEVQEEMGLAKQGSYVVSVKNPEAPGPANASLSSKPEWPKEVQEAFGRLRWMPLQQGVKHLEFANAQVLLVGEGYGELKGAVQDDGEEKKETAEEELEKLEGEDEERVEGLKGDDAVFADLKISHDEYPKLQTSW